MRDASRREASRREQSRHEKTRVISDAFALPHNRYGRYGCSSQGLILLTGEKRLIEKAASGSLVTPTFAANGQRDAKSGALVAALPPVDIPQASKLPEELP
jgi:hypothetical protein